MKKELSYFTIGKAFGGNQDWFTDYWMHIGGCAALAVCDSCICMEKNGVKKNLYPYDIANVTQEDYIAFGMQMKPYLRPRIGGIAKLEIYINGMRRYLKDIGSESLRVEGLASGRTVYEAVAQAKQQIDKGFPIPFLLLRHNNYNFRDLLWHWFMLTGYEEFEGEFFVKMTTYGGSRYISFRELWNSGYKNNGGMIIYS